MGYHSLLEVFMRLVVSCAFVLIALGIPTRDVVAQVPSGSMSAKERASLISSALSAGPAAITEKAAVMMPSPDGKMLTLREGSNGWTCFPDDPHTPGPDPMCADGEAMKWAAAWMGHAPRPSNMAPGIIYMLAGGTDPSASDPWATKPKEGEAWVKEPPHWMVMWPIDAKASGLPALPKKSGSWIMWNGTPFAHLMINQVP